MLKVLLLVISILLHVCALFSKECAATSVFGSPFLKHHCAFCQPSTSTYPLPTSTPNFCPYLYLDVCSPVEGGAGCRMYPNQGPWFVLPAQTSKLSIPSGSANWCQTCLVQVQPWFVYRLATASHWTGQVRINPPPWYRIEVHCAAHLKRDWLKPSFPFLSFIFVCGLHRISLKHRNECCLTSQIHPRSWLLGRKRLKDKGLSFPRLVVLISQLYENKLFFSLMRNEARDRGFVRYVSSSTTVARSTALDYCRVTDSWDRLGQVLTDEQHTFCSVEQLRCHRAKIRILLVFCHPCSIFHESWKRQLARKESRLLIR